MKKHLIKVGTQPAPCCDVHTMPLISCSCGWKPDRIYPGFDASAAVEGHRRLIVEEALGIKVEVHYSP